VPPVREQRRAAKTPPKPEIGGRRHCLRLPAIRETDEALDSDHPFFGIVLGHGLPERIADGHWRATRRRCRRASGTMATGGGADLPRVTQGIT
jgi:hypothetical protein